MALCPLMSKAYIDYTLSAGTLTGSGGGGGGSISLSDPQRDITSKAAGSDLDTKILKVECRMTECQLWDSDYGNCSLKSIILRFASVVGIESEKINSITPHISGNSLIKNSHHIHSEHMHILDKNNHIVVSQEVSEFILDKLENLADS